jgi:hypothetical protein
VGEAVAQTAAASGDAADAIVAIDLPVSGDAAVGPAPPQPAVRGKSVPFRPPGAVASRTKWTAQEMVLFEAALERHGDRHPKEIAQAMGTRDSEQVREKIRSLKHKARKLAAPAQPDSKEASMGGQKDDARMDAGGNVGVGNTLALHATES